MGKDPNQPRNIYSHAYELADDILNLLGVFEAKIETHHKLQYVEVIMHAFDKLEEAEKQGMCTNMYTKEPIKIKLPMDLIEDARQLYKQGSFEVITWRPTHPGSEQVEDETFEIVLQPPPAEELLANNQTCEPLPALFSLKSDDQKSGEQPLMRIQEAVPECIVYRYENPNWLTTVAKLYDEEMLSDGTILIKPYFKTTTDIKESVHMTDAVPRTWYNLKITPLFDLWKKIIIKVVITIWRMAQEMKSYKTVSNTKQLTSSVIMDMS